MTAMRVGRATFGGLPALVLLLGLLLPAAVPAQTVDLGWPVTGGGDQKDGWDTNIALEEGDPLFWGARAFEPASQSLIARSPAGNTFVAGYYQGTATFGNITLPKTCPDADCKRDIFVVKYDGAGTVLWARSAGGSGDDRAHAIALDSLENVYLAGSVQVSDVIGADLGVTFGTIPAGNHPDSWMNGFIASLDSGGGWRWAQEITRKPGAGPNEDLGANFALTLAVSPGDFQAVPDVVQPRVFVGGLSTCGARFGTTSLYDLVPLNSGVPDESCNIETETTVPYGSTAWSGWVAELSFRGDWKAVLPFKGNLLGQGRDTPARRFIAQLALDEDGGDLYALEIAYFEGSFSTLNSSFNSLWDRFHKLHSLAIPAGAPITINHSAQTDTTANNLGDLQAFWHDLKAENGNVYLSGWRKNRAAGGSPNVQELLGVPLDKDGPTVAKILDDGSSFTVAWVSNIEVICTDETTHCSFPVSDRTALSLVENASGSFSLYLGSNFYGRIVAGNLQPLGQPGGASQDMFPPMTPSMTQPPRWGRALDLDENPADKEHMAVGDIGFVERTCVGGPSAGQICNSDMFCSPGVCSIPAPFTRPHGSVDLFEKDPDNGLWSLTQTLIPPPAAIEPVGTYTALSEDFQACTDGATNCSSSRVTPIGSFPDATGFSVEACSGSAPQMVCSLTPATSCTNDGDCTALQPRGQKCVSSWDLIPLDQQPVNCAPGGTWEARDFAGPKVFMADNIAAGTQTVLLLDDFTSNTNLPSDGWISNGASGGRWVMANVAGQPTSCLGVTRQFVTADITLTPGNCWLDTIGTPTSTLFSPIYALPQTAGSIKLRFDNTAYNLGTSGIALVHITNNAGNKIGPPLTSGPIFSGIKEVDIPDEHKGQQRRFLFEFILPPDYTNPGNQYEWRLKSLSLVTVGDAWSTALDSPTIDLAGSNVTLSFDLAGTVSQGILKLQHNTQEAGAPVTNDIAVWDLSNPPTSSNPTLGDTVQVDITQYVTDSPGGTGITLDQIPESFGNVNNLRWLYQAPGGDGFISIDNVTLTVAPGLGFGEAVALDGDTLVVGAVPAAPPGAISDSGRAYVYKLISGTWQFAGEAVHPTGNTQFGSRVAVNGEIDRAIFGMPGQSGDAGSVIIFDTGLPGPPVPVAEIPGGPSEGLGMSVGITGGNGFAVAGARGTSAKLYGKDQGGADAWGLVKQIQAQTWCDDGSTLLFQEEITPAGLCSTNQDCIDAGYAGNCIPPAGTPGASVDISGSDVAMGNDHVAFGGGWPISIFSRYQAGLGQWEASANIYPSTDAALPTIYYWGGPFDLRDGVLAVSSRWQRVFPYNRGATAADGWLQRDPIAELNISGTWLPVALSEGHFAVMRADGLGNRPIKVAPIRLQDVFVARMGVVSGNWEWINAGGGIEREELGSIVAGPSTVHVLSQFKGAAQFGEPRTAGGTSPTSEDILVAQADELSGEWSVFETFVVGEAVLPPDGACVDTPNSLPPPTVTVNGTEDATGNGWFWSPPNTATGRPGRLFLTQAAGSVELEWRDSCDLAQLPNSIRQAGTAVWPLNACRGASPQRPCFQYHVAEAPVEVQPPDPGTGVTHSLVQLITPDAGSSLAQLDGQVFNAPEAGWSVLHYTLGAQPDIAEYESFFQVVRTVDVKSPLLSGAVNNIELPATSAGTDPPFFKNDQTCVIGTEIFDPDLHDEPARTGYVLFENAFYDGQGATAAYSRAGRGGRIVAVNRVNQARGIKDREKLMAIAWYRSNDYGVYWAERAAKYICGWPADPTVDKIVIAPTFEAGDGVTRERGSEYGDQDDLDPVGFPSLLLYDQPDPSLPGFNPNNEHALLAPSLEGNPFDAIWALRADFGAGIGSPQDASEPYVLAKYLDLSGGWLFKVYKVIATEQTAEPFFPLEQTVGEPIRPLYPLQTLLPFCTAEDETSVVGELTEEGQPPLPFYRDHQNLLWARAAGATPAATREGIIRWHYPVQAGFFTDEDSDDVSDSQYPVGTCIPLMRRLGPGLGGTADPSEPVNVTYQVSWPQSSCQVSNAPCFNELAVGETLLAGISSEAAIKVVHDQQQYQARSLGRYDPRDTLVRLIHPLTQRVIPLRSAELDDAELGTAIAPGSGLQKILGSRDNTKKLSPTLVRRLIWDPFAKKCASLPGGGTDPANCITGGLVFNGWLDDEQAGDPLLVPNVMSSLDLCLLKSIDGDVGGDCAAGMLTSSSKSCLPADGVPVDSAACTWDEAMDALYRLSRNPGGLELYAGSCALDGNVRCFMDSDCVQVGGTCDTACTVTNPAQGNLEFTPQITCDAGTFARDWAPSISDGPLVGFSDEDDDGVVDPEFSVLGGGAALSAGFARGTGFLVGAKNDDISVGGPVSLTVFNVGCINSISSYQGQISVIQPDNLFDEQVTLRHNADFAGNTDNVEFQWWRQGDRNGTAPPAPDPDDPLATNGWTEIPPIDLNGDTFDDHPGELTVGSAPDPVQALIDNWYLTRYRYRPLVDPDDTKGWGTGTPSEAVCSNNITLPCTPDPLIFNPTSDCGDAGATCDVTEQYVCDGEPLKLGWSFFAGQPGSPIGDNLLAKGQLNEGWVKRVLKSLNPYDARVNDFHTAPSSTVASLIQQVGGRYENDVALNADPENLNNVGLIEAYTTVLNRALTLKGSLNLASANNAVQLIATRIADFYKLLANEAYADALDPLIGISTDSPFFGIGSLAPAIFSFQNQVPALLDEELVLLHGRDDGDTTVTAGPVYNRFFPNFTIGDGEVAYQLTYNIFDINNDGGIDEFDALTQYPQGHGDAWGHYSMALRVHYSLLRNENFRWVPRPEAVTVAGVPIRVDFLDERKFAETAAARAKVGAEIVDLTYRQSYVEDPAGQWQGYKDTDEERAWGLSEWGRRAGQGAYLDWLTANAILPAEDTINTGIARIDRTTVPELDEIPTLFENIQEQMDEADRGLNPLGLAKGMVPFDIDPAQVDQGKTHFEQVFERAEQALTNVVSTWDYANTVTRMLRFNQDTIEDLTQTVREDEFDYMSRLMEIYGTPYPEDDIYPEGYFGPDLYHWQYIDLVSLAGERLDEADLSDPENGTVRRVTATWKPLPGGVGFFPEVGEKAGCLQTPFAKGCSLGGVDAGTLSVDYLTWDSPQFGRVTVRPPEWSQPRQMTGRIQTALQEMARSQLEQKRALREYHNITVAIEAVVDKITAFTGLEKDKLAIVDNTRLLSGGIGAAILGAKVAEKVLKSKRDSIRRAANTAASCLPTVVGFSNDVTSGARCSIQASGFVASETVGFAAEVAAASIELLKAAKDQLNKQEERDIQVLEGTVDAQFIQAEIEEILREEPAKRAELFQMAQAAQQSEQVYRNALTEGIRLLDELVLFRKKTAAAVQEYRYEDIAFRLVRNDALQKYRAAFDLAARYAYLSAMAYDYDTNLLGSSSGAGQDFLADIVRERSLGQVLLGEPVAGSRGLADPLGRMKQNFAVLKGQMGFNNPQQETNRFSLRREFFKLTDTGPNGDAAWREVLGRYKVDDLWQVPEFTRFAKPFAPRNAGAQPGLVIPFESTVTFSRNFFNKPLEAGNSAYDSSNFSTRVRSVGVWLDEYGMVPLSNTPRVYLLPAGADVMRAAQADNFETREWDVVDQSLPVPFPIGDNDLADPSFIPTLDSQTGTFAEIRRLSSFRAYDFSPTLDPSEFTTDSRLVGRSVWNTKWVLIIPGGNLLNDPQEGIDIFVDGQLIPGGNGARDGQGVKDIYLFFETYAYTGE